MYVNSIRKFIVTTTLILALVVTGNSGIVLAADLATDVPLGNAPAQTITLTPGRTNVRSGPGLHFPVVETVPGSITMPVIGRNATNTWWVVPRAGRTSPGWISASVAVLNGHSGQLPIIDAPTSDIHVAPARVLTFHQVEWQRVAWVEDVLPEKHQHQYVFNGSAGDLAMIRVDSFRQMVNFKLTVIETGEVLKDWTDRETTWKGNLPTKSRYLITLKDPLFLSPYTLTVTPEEGVPPQPQRPPAIDAPIIRTGVEAVSAHTAATTKFYQGPGFEYSVMAEMDSQFPAPVDGLSEDYQWWRASCRFAPENSDCEEYWIPAAEVAFRTLEGNIEGVRQQ